MRRQLINVLFNTTLKEFYLQFRRYFYYYFRRKKMMESIAKRKGYCNYKVCGGFCCGHCNTFDKKTKKCKIQKNKPTINCRFFPFDEKDKSGKSRHFCTYYWEKD